MKKILISLIFTIAMIFTTSCGALWVGTQYGTYDPNDSYYLEASPYYHRQHYYNDYYYDRRSNYFQNQHVYRDDSPTIIIKQKDNNRNRDNRSNRRNDNRTNNRENKK